MTDFEPSFFELQLDFAGRIAKIGDVDGAEAIHRFTAVSGLTGKDWPVGCRADAIHHAYLRERARQEQESGRTWFGCFGYEYPWRDTTKLRLHFANRCGGRPLAREAIDERKAELGELIAHAMAAYPEITIVRGGSWLYNVDAYRRLFPAVFIEAARETPPEPQYMSTWGQFVTHTGSVQEVRAAELMQGAANATDVGGCLDAFPLPRIELECGLDDFARGLY